MGVVDGVGGGGGGIPKILVLRAPKGIRLMKILPFLFSMVEPTCTRSHNLPSNLAQIEVFGLKTPQYSSKKIHF